MNIVLFGSSGMLGHDFQTLIRRNNNLLIMGGDPKICVDRLACPSHADVHLASRTDVNQYLVTMKSQGFDTVVNCAAATDVNAIQSCINDEMNSYKVNALGPKYLAEACARLGMRLIHISTDYVYSDERPEEFPVNIYGYHKLIGELNIKAAMKDNYAILRVGCLYGMHNSKSFLHKFLRNVANAVRNNFDSVNVIDYQLTTPTSTHFVCNRMIDILRTGMVGTYTTSPRGCATRWEFAKKIVELCGKHGVFGNWEFQDGFVKKGSSDQIGYMIPKFSAMYELNLETHLYGNPATTTWEDVLDDFIGANKDELTAWFKGLIEEKK